MKGSDHFKMTWPMFCRGECQLRGKTIKLSLNEKDLLICLVVNRGRAVSIAELVEACYPDCDFEPEWAEKAITHCLSKLRHKMPEFIYNFRQHHYFVPVENLELKPEYKNNRIPYLHLAA